MSAFTDMFIELSNSAAFRRAGIAPITNQMAVFLFGGLRELSALAVEDGADGREIVETAVTAAIAILGRAAAARPTSSARTSPAGRRCRSRTRSPSPP